MYTGYFSSSDVLAYQLATTRDGRQLWVIYLIGFRAYTMSKSPYALHKQGVPQLPEIEVSAQWLEKWVQVDKQVG